MNAKELARSSDGQRTFALIFETGDEVTGKLTEFADQNHLAGSHFSAIGAFRDVTIAWFDWESKKYKHIDIREQVEALSLIGDVADDNGKAKVHAHLVIGKSDGSAHGGHLIEAHVRPTLELILSEMPRHLQRRHDPQTGLALIRL